MIDVKQAVAIALKYVLDLEQTQIINLDLEEVELSPNGNQWYVTVGYERVRPTPTSLAAVLGANPRIYKIVTINRDTGEPVSLKIRKL